MEDVGDWCLIESDPGVFSELMRGFGVKGLECEEVFDISDLSHVQDAIGFIFLFKFEEKSQVDGTLVDNAEESTLFFAKQIIKNACATQAIINILLNTSQSTCDVGETLNDFKTFVMDFDSSLKGTALGNSEKIKLVHNSFSNTNLIQLDEKLAAKDDDVYHFVGYVPVNNVIYELDGLKKAPIKHCVVPEGQHWVDVVQPVIDSRMKKCMDGRFNLMAIVPDRLVVAQKKLELMGGKDAELEAEIASLKIQRADQKAENIRRKHNYFPLIVNLLKLLAREGRLCSLVEDSFRKEQERKARAAVKA